MSETNLIQPVWAAHCVSLYRTIGMMPALSPYRSRPLRSRSTCLSFSRPSRSCPSRLSPSRLSPSRLCPTLASPVHLLTAETGRISKLQMWFLVSPSPSPLLAFSISLYRASSPRYSLSPKSKPPRSSFQKNASPCVLSNSHRRCGFMLLSADCRSGCALTIMNNTFRWKKYKKPFG